MDGMRNVGGTSGGLLHFVVGLGLLVVGGYLFADRLTVHGGYWTFFGSAQTSFGLTLIPVMLGIGMLFFDGKSRLGWVLMIGGLLAIFAGAIANLNLYYRSTSLVGTLIMLGLAAAGLGLIVRALFPVEGNALPKDVKR